jgi:hypothetical protein
MPHPILPPRGREKEKIEAENMFEFYEVCFNECTLSNLKHYPLLIINYPLQ